MTHESFLALKRFPALDGVRAIAALMVVFFHYGGPEWLQGWLGVQVFFVLSGFLITTLLLREQARNGRVSLRNFYRRRAFRILPVYFVVLFVTAAGLLIAGQFWQNPLGRDFPLYLTFFNEFGHGGAYGQSWSLGVEQKFYLVWPLLAFALLPRWRPAVTAGLMALALAVVPFTVSSDPKGWSVHYITVLVGCAVALLMHNPRGFALIRPLMKPWMVLPFVGVHLCVGLISGALDGAIPGFVSVVPIYAIAVGLMLPSLLAPGLPQRLLSTRPMGWLGERSYSIYLVQTIAHAVVLLTGASGLVMALLTSLVAIGIADLCYRFVELPMIERGRSHRPIGNATAPIGQ
ncbi:acyltransferase family protein [Lentzea sp. NPDC051213]|uniref:acyltransferase family protein n=1 Tax=Lentzea sp. NPDC051213 TaxID=3364126 RepID=UPI0037925137